MSKDNRTYADRAEYIRKAVKKRRLRLREMSRIYKGGKCAICGYNRCQSALVFHHINPDEKKFGLSAGGFTRSWDKTKSELDKCILLCSNCHMEVHDKITQLPEETQE